MPTRYTSRPFPAYRHRPGLTPHPVRDPDGHSYEKTSANETVDEDSWFTSETYLFAIDLLNDGYYWEAHEELEGLWLTAGRDSPIGRFLQGIIQLAAALLKLEAGKTQSATKLCEAAAAKLREPAQTYLGLDGERLAEQLEHRLGNPDQTLFRVDLILPT